MDVKKINVGGKTYEIKDETARKNIDAVKIQAGNSKKPVYFSVNGIPTACSYTLDAACAKGVATSVASGNANLVTSGAVYTALADRGEYEEGTWTPVCSQNGVQIPTAAVDGKYFKIGNWCYIRGTLSLLGNSVVSHIGGLPKVQDHSFMCQNMGITIGHLGSSSYNSQRFHFCDEANNGFEIKTKDTVQASTNWMIEGWYKCI